MYVNHDGGDGFFNEYGTSGLSAAVEIEMEANFKHWDKCESMGVQMISPLSKEKKSLPVKWSKRWKVDKDYGIFECRGIAINAMNLRARFGKDYRSGALWLAEQLRSVATQALREIERNFLGIISN